MQKTFISLIIEFVEENGRKILENPDRFKSLFLDFSQNQYKAEVQIFCQFLASPQAQEIRQSSDVDELFLKGVADRFHQAYLFKEDICKQIIFAYVQFLGLVDKKVFEAGLKGEVAKPKIKIDKQKDKKKKEKVIEDKIVSNFSKKNKKIILIAVAIIAVIGFSIFGVNKSIETQQQRVAIEAQRQREAEIQRQKELEEEQRQREEEARIQRELEIRRQMEAAGLVFIQGGTFMMGSPISESGRIENEIQRQVTVSSFNMGKFTVTQKEYQEVMGVNPSHFRSENFPVEQVTWFDAIEYCIRRSQREGLTPAYTITNRVPATGHPITSATVTWNRNANGYRLPTEAEWEYACRAGTTTAYNTGNNITTSQANFSYSFGRTTPIRNYFPNVFGLYDMHGNVWEWCWDWYGFYSFENTTDPMGASSGYFRVLRGGSFQISAANLRSACRGGNTPSARGFSSGFRIVRNAN
ncbi:MAG: formylglycine-generating enzyme family protein [Treponema sp.]|nr:formylglycine-generating enzyme family protein [Treponema sp.]